MLVSASGVYRRRGSLRATRADRAGDPRGSCASGVVPASGGRAGAGAGADGAQLEETRSRAGVCQPAVKLSARMALRPSFSSNCVNPVDVISPGSPSRSK